MKLIINEHDMVSPHNAVLFAALAAVCKSSSAEHEAKRSTDTAAETFNEALNPGAERAAATAPEIAAPYGEGVTEHLAQSAAYDAHVADLAAATDPDTTAGETDVVGVDLPGAATYESAGVSEEQAPNIAPPSVPVSAPTTQLLDGIPWDARIHAGSKGTVAGGTKWRNKPKVDPELLEAVTLELRTAYAVPAAEVIAPPTITPPHPVEGPEAQPVAHTFATLLGAISAAVAANPEAQTQVDAALAAHGVASLPVLGARPDLIPAIVATLGDLIA